MNYYLISDGEMIGGWLLITYELSGILGMDFITKTDLVDVMK